MAGCDGKGKDGCSVLDQMSHIKLFSCAYLHKTM